LAKAAARIVTDDSCGAWWSVLGRAQSRAYHNGALLSCTAPKLTIGMRRRPELTLFLP
jgi:hypothetical protein